MCTATSCTHGRMASWWWSNVAQLIRVAANRRTPISCLKQPRERRMRVGTFAILAAAALSLAGSASAQTSPPDTLLSGEVGQQVVSNQCYIVRGGSDFL